jgi:hypothetical protein
VKSREVLGVFNRGRVSRLALARTDVSRVALAAEVQTNFLPRRLGPMSLRPGLEYLGALPTDFGVYLPFIYANDDTAILDLTPEVMRVWIDGDTLLERDDVDSTVSNGNFTTDLTGWTDDDEAGAASTWATGGYMELLGTGYAAARRYQEVTVAAADEDTVHALRIVIERGPVLLRIGSTAGNDDIFRQAVLRTGTHSIAFTPGGNFFVQFSSTLKYPTLIDSCQVEAAGAVELPTPWDGTADLRRVRWDRSGDVVFVACRNMQPRRIERRPDNSWSVVLYEPDDGPFQVENVERVTLTPSAISGEITLTASQPMFRAAHVGALWRITSQGQLVEADISAANAFSGEIRVTGVGNDRRFTVTRAGTWSATISLQRSIGAPGAWVTVATYTGNASVNYDDGLDNVEAYYRIGIETGNYTSGTAELSLEFSAGSITGVVRITARTSSTVVDAIVLTDLGGTDATEIWAEGAWSDDAIWPETVAIWEDRIWWAASGQVWASVSSTFDTFDPDTEGDSGPISRLLAGGATGRANWSLPLQRLIIGTDTKEVSVRSNSLDEPVTPTNYNAKAPTSQGSAAIPAASHDDRGYFVNKTSRQVHELQFNGETFNFGTLDLTLLVPEISDSPFRRIAVQTTPDFRLHCVRADGTVAVLVRDAAEDVLCWVDVETSGTVEDVCVLPGDVEDRVFYRVRRYSGGVPARYHERMALQSEAIGGTDNKMADSFVATTETTATTTLTGLDHLEDRTVVVWADGAYVGEAVVIGGEVELADAVTTWCAGLPYTGQFKTAKIAGQTQMGLALNQGQRINKLCLILADTHASGVQYGPDFDTLDDLPLIENGEEVDPDHVWDHYDSQMIEFDGDWTTDPRLCLQAQAPKPCTVLAVVIGIDRHDTP